VWARNGVAIYECPKTFITAQSMAWLETYLVRQRLHQEGVEGSSAREVEAFLIMEYELQEVQHG